MTRVLYVYMFFFKQKTAYEMRISDWSSDVCSSDLNSHTDPGKYWDWARYYSLINPTSGTTTILDSFESSVGHFVTSPTYSGSTTGVSTASTAKRNCSIRHNGSCSL